MCIATPVGTHRRLAEEAFAAGKHKDDITDLACFIGIYPHAYAWLEEKPITGRGAAR